jgi:hypothetical protein
MAGGWSPARGANRGTTVSHGGWAPITGKAAVTVDGESLDVADLILLGVLTGEWPAFEDRVALGLELERAHPDDVPAEEVRREATAFRYAHGLISAADFRAWLEAHQMTVAGLSGVLRRRLLRARHVRSEGPAASEDEVIGVLWAEVFCDGVLARRPRCRPAGRSSRFRPRFPARSRWPATRTSGRRSAPPPRSPRRRRARARAPRTSARRRRAREQRS